MPLDARRAFTSHSAVLALVLSLAVVRYGGVAVGLTECMRARLASLSAQLSSSSSSRARGRLRMAHAGAGDEHAELSVFMLIGQSNMAGRGGARGSMVPGIRCPTLHTSVLLFLLALTQCCIHAWSSPSSLSAVVAALPSEFFTPTPSTTVNHEPGGVPLR